MKTKERSIGQLKKELQQSKTNSLKTNETNTTKSRNATKLNLNIKNINTKNATNKTNKTKTNQIPKIKCFDEKETIANNGENEKEMTAVSKNDQQEKFQNESQVESEAQASSEVSCKVIFWIKYERFR